MSSCHPAGSDANLATGSALQRLSSFVDEQRRRREGVRDLEAFERELRSVLMAVEMELVGEELAKHDVDVPLVVIHGVAHRRKLRCEQTYLTAAGPVRVTRTLYSTGQGDPASCPMELGAGIVEGRWTPLAARQATWVVAHLTPQEGEELFAQIGGMTPSKSSLDRLPKALSERWEAAKPEFERALREAETVPAAARAVAVSLDGVMVPMKDGGRTGKRDRARAEGKQTKGPAGYCEVGCGTLSFYDKDGTRLSTIRFARMPQEKKVELKDMLTEELHRVLEQRPHLTIVKVADGARDNWDYLSAQLPVGVEVVDFFHAAEHLRRALAEAYGETSKKGLVQFQKLRAVLLEDDDGVAKIIRALCYQRDKHPHNRQIQAELTYFRRNCDRMRYAEVAALNLPIGSGVVEAACKTLVTQRMKRSGMRWLHAGGQAILTFRSLLQSNRFERAWPGLVETYKAAVTVPDNVVPLTRHGATSRVSA